MRAAEHIFSKVFVIFAFIRRSVQTLLRDNELVNDLGGLSHPLAIASVSSISRQSLRKKRLMCCDPTINRQNLPSDEDGCKLGRASCRERVGQYVKVQEAAVSFKK